MQCPYTKKCGGCRYTGIDYSEQLNAKLKRVRALLSPYCDVEGIDGMEHPYNYRCKVTATFSQDRSRRITTGRYAEGTRRVITVDRCLIENSWAVDRILTLRELARSFKLQS